MKTINEYFDRVFAINLKRRPDRLAHFEEQCAKHNIKFERFEAYDIAFDGNSNTGCNCSHRAIMEIVAYQKIPRALIFEDDNEFVYEDTQERFSKAIAEVPGDWSWLWLGGSYGSEPKGRISEHVMEIDTMMTTSSYAVTWQTAREVAPWISGPAGIDSLYHGFTQRMKAYSLVPRLCVQYTNVSDIQHRVMDNRTSMEDPHHEARHPWPPK